MYSIGEGDQIVIGVHQTKKANATYIRVNRPFSLYGANTVEYMTIAIDISCEDNEQQLY